MAIQEAVPAEVVGEIVGADAMEPGDPGLEAAVVGVDVLDVEGLANAYVGTQVHRFVHDGHGFGERFVNRAPYGTGLAGTLTPRDGTRALHQRVSLPRRQSPYGFQHPLEGFLAHGNLPHKSSSLIDLGNTHD